MRKLLCLSAVFACIVASQASCGGGAGSVGPPPPPAVTSVSVSCSPSSITTAETSTCTPVVTKSDGTTDALATMAASIGTIANGVYTPPAVTAQTTVTITATSTENPSKSGTTTVTVTPAVIPRSITGIVPLNIYCDAECGIVSVEIDGAGFVSGDLLNTTPNANLQLVQFVSSTKLVAYLGLDTPHYLPGWFGFSDCSSDGSVCSNTANFAYLGNQNELASSATEAFQLNPITGPVDKFTLPAGSSDGTINTGGDTGIAVDDKTGYVVLSGNAGTTINELLWFDQSGNLQGASASNGEVVVAAAAKNGIGCTTQPAAGLLSCVDLTQFSPPMTSVAAGTEPWSLAMVTLGSGTTAETDAIVYSRESTEIRRYSVANVNGTIGITLQGALTLSGITPESQIPVQDGGWQLVAFGSGPAAGTAAFLSQYDKTLVFVNLASMTEIGRVALQGVPFRIAADETHGTVVVAFADVPAGLTRFAKVDVATGTVTNLTATSNLLSVGLLVSADGANIYAAMRDQLQVLPNQ